MEFSSWSFRIPGEGVCMPFYIIFICGSWTNYCGFRDFRQHKLISLLCSSESRLSWLFFLFCVAQGQRQGAWPAGLWLRDSGKKLPLKYWENSVLGHHRTEMPFHWSVCYLRWCSCHPVSSSFFPFLFEIRYQTAHTALKFEREPGTTLIFLSFSFYLPNAKIVGIYHHTQLIVLRFEPRDFCMPFKHSANWVTSATLHSPAWNEKQTFFWFLMLTHLLSFTRGSSLFLRVYVILWLDLNWLKLDSPRHSIASGS